MKINQRGFSVVEAVLITVGIGLVVFIGWYVWQSGNNPDNKQSATSQQAAEKSQKKPEDKQAESKKTFDCNGIFTLKYPGSLMASMTTSVTPQCLISNVTTDEMPPVGALPPEQLGLFFSTSNTTATTSSEYLESYIEQSEQDLGALKLRSQKEISLDNGKTASLAKVYGGHPGPHEFYFFVYVKGKKVITTEFPVKTDYKTVALDILKSIE